MYNRWQIIPGSHTLSNFYSASDFCFVIACHDKTEELLCHLEILTFFPEPFDVIIVHSGPQPLPDAAILRNVIVVRPEAAKTPPLGAALALLKGISTVSKLPLPYIRHTFKYMCFRNCDDWLFNHKQVLKVLTIMRQNNIKLVGYNWFKRNNFDNLTLNELFFDMKIFDGKNLDEWGSYFKKKIEKECEWAVADKLFEIVKKEDFYRLTDREHDFGIGTRTNAQDKTANNRYWNMDWLMLGHHDQNEKRQFYNSVRSMIPYAIELERKEHFRRWLKH